MSSMFIHFVAYYKTSLLSRLYNIPLYEYTIFCVFFHPLMGHLGCFHIVAMVNNDAMKTGVLIIT